MIALMVSNERVRSCQRLRLLAYKRRDGPDGLGLPGFVVWPIFLEEILTPMREELSIAMLCCSAASQTVRFSEICWVLGGKRIDEALGWDGPGVLTSEGLAWSGGVGNCSMGAFFVGELEVRAAHWGVAVAVVCSGSLLQTSDKYHIAQ